MRESKVANQPARNDPCWCGSGRKFKKCHMLADKPGASPLPPSRSSATLIKTPAQIEGIRKSCHLTRDILELLEQRVAPGVTTNQIDRWVHDYTVSHGAQPSPLNYKGFPKSVCTSVNEVVCHGIPEDRVLLEGDIVNIDVTCTLDGYFGDSSRMYMVGAVSPEARKLVQVTRECLGLGIAQVRPGGFIGDIGHAIQAHAEKHGFSVVRDFVGHGTGVQFHEEPQVPHFGRKGTGQSIQEGMVFTIEPMINAGDWRVRILSDRWTAVTADGSLSAQFEHTLLVTPQGADVLTA